MFLARVIGELVSTMKHRSLHAQTLLIIDRIDLDDRGTGVTMIAVDAISAGVGDTVLVVDEGGSASIVTRLAEPPIRTVIVGIVDQFDVEV